MSDASPAQWDGSEELKPFDDLLRQASRCKRPEPPKDLCNRTLKRCLMHAAGPESQASAARPAARRPNE